MKFFSPSSFWTPEYIVDSAWLEHAPFAFWLMETHRPSCIVELGTHHGFSYCCFCQAIERLELDTRAFAVDSWKGDEHAQFYGEDVLQVLGTYHRSYESFSKLVRSSFDEAAKHFEDGSIDLLHIDGRHFYEDVRHDFDTWRPKLSGRAIVLFHDTNVRDRDFGVFRLWSEVREGSPSFEFIHGHGLGVLGYGKDQSPHLAAFFSECKSPIMSRSIRRAYAALGRSITIAHQKDELDRNLERLRRGHKETQASLAAAEKSLEDFSRRAHDLEAHIVQQDAFVNKLEAEVLACQQITTELESKLIEGNADRAAIQTELSALKKEHCNKTINWKRKERFLLNQTKKKNERLMQFQLKFSRALHKASILQNNISNLADNFSKEKSLLTIEINEHKSEAIRLQRQLYACQSSMDTHVERNIIAETLLAAANAEKFSLKTALNKRTVELNEAEQRAVSLAAAFDEATTTLTNALNKVAMLEKTLSEREHLLLSDFPQSAHFSKVNHPFVNPLHHRLGVKVAAALRHPFNSGSRKKYRQWRVKYGAMTLQRHSTRSQLIKLNAFIRHPLSHQRRKDYRTRHRIRQNPLFQGISSDVAALEGSPAGSSASRNELNPRLHDGPTITSASFLPGSSAIMRPRHRAMVLIAADFLPLHDHHSGGLRLKTLIEMIGAQGWAMVFASYVGVHDLPGVLARTSGRARYETELRQAGVVHFTYGAQELDSLLPALGADLRYAFLSFPFVANEFLPLVRDHCPAAKVIYDMVDFHGLRMQREADLKGDVSLAVKSIEMKNIEVAAARASDITIAVSADEKKALLGLVPTAVVDVLPNVFEVPSGTFPSFANRRDIMFLGNFWHKPNGDAVTWFVENIWLNVHQRMPECRFLIAGSNPDPTILALREVPGVEVLGHVPELRPLFDAVRICVAPLRYGAGVKGKVGQSLVHGVPVVATGIGVEGMGLVDGEHVLVADDPRLFAEQTLRLLEDEVLWRKLQLQGLRFMVTHYSVEALDQKVRELFRA